MACDVDGAVAPRCPASRAWVSPDARADPASTPVAPASATMQSKGSRFNACVAFLLNMKNFFLFFLFCGFRICRCSFKEEINLSFVVVLIKHELVI